MSSVYFQGIDVVKQRTEEIFAKPGFPLFINPIAIEDQDELQEEPVNSFIPIDGSAKNVRLRFFPVNKGSLSVSEFAFSILQYLSMPIG